MSWTEERHRKGPRHCGACSIHTSERNCFACGRFTAKTPMVSMRLNDPSRVIAGQAYKWDPNMTHFKFQGEVLEICDGRPF